jgi:superfamily I DNA/RNA helicase/RecB family exonuclease
MPASDPLTYAGREVLLGREVLSSDPPPSLDAVQQQVVAHRGGPLRVLGAPGTGKTTTLVEAVVDRVEGDGLDAGAVLVLAPTRLAAARLRERVTARLARTVREPLARTPQSFAFGVLRRVAAAADEAAPRLISGPEQDLVLRELLAGHVAGVGARPQWPTDLLPALATRGFRGQLRDLVMRAVERGVDAVALAELGARHGRPEWVAAAHVLQEYLDVTALAAPGAYDPASITGAAAAALADDPVLLDEVRAQTRFVAVDDAHEATPAVAALVRAVVGATGELLLVGDPDAATQGFRGADPALLVDGPGPVLRLPTAWRQGAALRQVTQRVASRIGTVGGASHRLVTEPPEPRPAGSVEVHVLRSTTQEASFVAELLRRHHLERRVPWSQMAVVVRGGSRTSTLRRVLTAAGVPVDVPPTEQPVRDQAAVVPLLDVFETALALGRGVEQPLDADRAVSLLTSPLGGADAVALRRLRRALRSQELGAGRPSDPDGVAVPRTSDELLVASLLDPALLAGVDASTAAPAHRVARVLNVGVHAAQVSDDVTAETILWAIWSASGLAEPWRRTALAGGPAGARADRDLDAVVALFDAAARFVDRLPHAGPAEFVQHLRGQEVPGDTLVERGSGRDAVALVTPQGAAGSQWRVVVVSGVQDGVWPDLRLRGSLLGSEVLVDLLTGRDPSPRAALKAVRDDETRLFHVAVSRASEHLVVTAVRDEDEQPSPFLDLVDPLDDAAEGLRPLTPAPRPLSLPGLVARLRQVVTDPASPPALHAAAAHELSRTARAAVPGAHPDDWYGLHPLSDDAPLATGQPVRISPSRVEEFERCALRWLLTTSGGRAPSSRAQQLGNLVHEIAAEHPDADEQTLADELHRRWGRLGLGSGWVADSDRARLDRMVRKLASYIAENRGRWSVVGTELPFEVLVELPDGPAVLTGRVDRVEQDGQGALRVVDLKTGKSSPANGEVPRHAQLGVYQVAVEQGGFTDGQASTSGGAALVQLGTPAVRHKEQPQPPLSADDDPGWARDLVNRVATGMAGAEFAATVGDLCTVCPVRTSCPAQSDGRAVTQ